MSGTFEGQKLVVVGGSSGIGRNTAADVVAGGGSAVIIGREQARVDETVAALSKDGRAYGIAVDLADRMQVARVQQQRKPGPSSWPCPSGQGTGRPAPSLQRPHRKLPRFTRKIN